MAKKISFVSKLGFCLGLGLAIAFTVWWSIAAQAADEKNDAHQHQGHHAMQMSHIKTQAEVDALKPGDCIAMVCSMCKHVTVHHVTKDQSCVEMMTIGHKHACAVCDGAVTVVGTGKGKGKSEEVKHVCSKCGDDAMFVCAMKSGSGSMHHHGSDKK